MVAQQLGHDMDELEEPDELRKLRYRLEGVGLTTDQAREVVSAFDPDLIEQQLDWLPYRHAKNPAGYLLAAIEGGYEEPRVVRQERLLRELRFHEQLFREDQEQAAGQSASEQYKEEEVPETQVPDEQQPELQGDEEDQDAQDEQQPIALPQEPMGPVSPGIPGMVDINALGEDESVSLTPDE